VFPAGGVDVKPGNIAGATSIPYLLNLSSERRAAIRVYIGHFPYIAYQMLGIPCVTATILREPIARSISHVMHVKRQPRFRDVAYEAIYEDPYAFGFFLHNHQTKYFSMTEDDPLKSIMNVIDIDDRRLALAKANLEQIDVVGLIEQYDAFLGEFRERFGWTVQAGVVANVSTENWEPSAAMRRKIEADNEGDIELYEHARALLTSRRRARTFP
jgi:hypothetical protein